MWLIWHKKSPRHFDGLEVGLETNRAAHELNSLMLGSLSKQAELEIEFSACLINESSVLGSARQKLGSLRKTQLDYRGSCSE